MAGQGTTSLKTYRKMAINRQIWAFLPTDVWRLGYTDNMGELRCNHYRKDCFCGSMGRRCVRCRQYVCEKHGIWYGNHGASLVLCRSCYYAELQRIDSCDFTWLLATFAKHILAVP